MGNIVHCMEVVKQKIEEENPKSFKAFLKIINRRWKNNLVQDLHRAAYYLNPDLHYKNNLRFRKDLMESLKDVINKLAPNINSAKDAVEEVKYFREATQRFADHLAIRARGTQRLSNLGLISYPYISNLF
ncbi:uncharacterized protein LOC122057643 isoform X1 [Macadamia integrifolia]|uniref:uncharacterized protein LOC122057643 isoform X1 n=1 Tax=Macadamia integrifolia TaxID=60698 RepID=UPI001C527A42|nr:uncharacterized protein LOC122057643 isoform X1 [Macadamia integrifolia]